MECAGNGRALLDPRPVEPAVVVEAVGTGGGPASRWPTCSARVRLAPDAVEVVFTGADRGVEDGVEQAYARSLPVAEATGSDALLAYEVNGVPLPPQHGFPLRLIVPGWYGMTNVKWLTSIAAVATPFTGYQQMTSYRLRQHADEAGVPLTRMLPRALMIPPGIPDFVTRERYAAQRRAPPQRPRLVRRRSDHHRRGEQRRRCDRGSRRTSTRASRMGAWQAWRYVWQAGPGTHQLCCRATDAAGNAQPLHPRWNVGGYANNAVQRVTVHVS